MSRASESVAILFPQDALKQIEDFAASAGTPGVAFIVESLRAIGIRHLPPRNVPRSLNIQARVQLCLPPKCIIHIVSEAEKQGLGRNVWVRNLVLNRIGYPIPVTRTVSVMKKAPPAPEVKIKPVPVRKPFRDYELSYASTLSPEDFKALQKDNSRHPVTGEPWVPVPFQGDSKWQYGVRLPLATRYNP